MCLGILEIKVLSLTDIEMNVYQTFQKIGQKKWIQGVIKMIIQKIYVVLRKYIYRKQEEFTYWKKSGNFDVFVVPLVKLRGMKGTKYKIFLLDVKWAH